MNFSYNISFAKHSIIDSFAKQITKILKESLSNKDKPKGKNYILP